MAMRKLSADLQCLISSSLQINNFKQVVEELVYNSLDAKATSIAVRIDITEKNIQVVDNGCGITETDFDLLGHKYSTSKCVDLNTLKSVPNTYGFRGQFLANLINIAQKVKITSRFEKCKDTWVKIFYNGKERDLARSNSRPSVGTTVEVHGIFYNLHIQRKNLDTLNELTEIKTLLKQLSLVHSCISISLRDDSKNEIIFKVHKNRNIYQTFGLLFNIDEEDVSEFKVEKKEYKVIAYFSKKNKNLGPFHWVYLNGKFINNCKLHKIINDSLNKSLKVYPKRKIKTKIGDVEDTVTKSDLPFYIILLSCPYYDYDISDLSKHTSLEFKNWQDITNLINKLVTFYSEDETLMVETVINNDAKPKKIEGDTRYEVRKIVEKLLKSNSKKIGVSQMRNGVKGKLTKRRKNKVSLKETLSLSKVIPSKNKITRKKSKNISKKIKLSDKAFLESNKDGNNIIENAENDNNSYIREETCNYNVTSPEHILQKKENYEWKKTKATKRIYHSKKQNHNTKNSNSPSKHLSKRKENYKQLPHLETLNSFYPNYSFKDSIKIDVNSKSLNYTDIEIALKENNKKIKTHFYDKEQIIQEKDNGINLCNIDKNNKEITLRKEMAIYDYIPHPLNSTQDSDRNQSKMKNKSHICSRDLVKTILNTQEIEHEEKPKPQQSKDNIYENYYTPIHNIKQNRMIILSNDRDSTFNAWNADLQSVSHFSNKITDEGIFVSKMTFESHHYNKNNSFDNFNLKLGRSKRFMTKQSKENFIVSVDKQKYRNYRKHKPKCNVFDVNMTFGLKKYFKNRNISKESSVTIEFSDSAIKNRVRDINHIQSNKFIFPREKGFIYTNKKSDEKSVDKYSVNTQIKNTYTICENTLNTSVDYNISCDVHESIIYPDNLMQETYTISTNNKECLSHQKHNIDQENNEQVINNANESNIVFLSEQHKDVDDLERSEDSTIDPANICETIFNDSDYAKSTKDEFNLNHNIDKQCMITREEPPNELQGISLQEVSCNSIINKITFTNPFQIFNMKNNEKLYTEDNENILNDITRKFESTIINEVSECMNKIAEERKFYNFNIKNRPRYMPKGMSQIFENCNTKGTSNYNINDEYYKINIYEDFVNEVELNSEIFQPRIQNATEKTTKAIEKVNTKIQKENSSLTFDGTLLKQAQVLGQVDGKFIAAIVKSRAESTDFLVLFDQHAVHERIRLEQNMSYYFNEQKWKSIKLDAFVLKLTKDEILYLHNFKEKFVQLGLEWEILSDCEVSVCGIPQAILGKNPRQVEKVITAVKHLILEEISAIQIQSGCISLHPKSIMDLVFSEACRYAIKFGDKLTLNNCIELIESLSECRTPFQCAHGRPVMAVLTEMTISDVSEYKIDATKIRLFSKTK